MKLNKSYYDYKDTSERIYEFVKTIEEKASNYDVIVLTTRRCFCLISCAQKKYNLLSQTTTNKLISSQAVDIYGSNFDNKRVLFVDDIMIHGRAIYNLNLKVKKYNALNTDTFVLSKNLEFPDFYKYATGNNYESMFLLSNSDWKKLSNDILEFFETEKQMYTSYIFSLKNIFPNSEYLYRFSNDEFLKVVPEYIKKSNHKTFYYFYKNNTMSKYNCLREYVFDNGEKIYVPYCELKDFTQNSLSISWNRFLKKLNINKDLHLYSFTACDIYKAYTVILSLYDYDLDSITSDEINQSYYADFLNDVKIIISKLKKRSFVLDDVSEFIIKCGLVENKEQIINKIASFYEFESIIDSDKSLKWFSEYITKISSFEEETYKTEIYNKHMTTDKLIYHRMYINGKIPVSNIINNIKFNTEYEYYKFISFVIFLLDVGSVSQIVETFENNKEERIAATSIKTGEQSYKIQYAKNPLAFLIAAKFFDYYSFYNNDSVLDEEEIDKYIVHLKDDVIPRHLEITKQKSFSNNDYQDSLLQCIKEFLLLKKVNLIPDMMDTYIALVTEEHLESIKYILDDLPKYF